MKKKTLLIIETRVSPYREPLYKGLDQEYNCFWIFTQETNETIKNTFLKNKTNLFIPKKIKIGHLVPLTFIFFKLLFLKHFDYCLSAPSIYPESWQAFIISKVKGIKLLLRDEEFKRKKSGKRKLIMPITKLINRHSDFILVPTTKHKEWQLSLGVKKEKIILFPNVTNLDLKNVDKNKIEDLKKKHEIGDKKVFMYIGRLIELKGVQYLIDAYYNLIKLDKKYIKNTILIIVGDGIYKKKLKEQSKRIKDIGGNVIFTGHIDNSQLINYYKLAYTGIVPSINIKGSNEAYGLVVNEWMIAGKPVITTNMVGATYALLNNNKLKKFIVKEKNSKSINKLLKYLLEIDIKKYDNIKKDISTIIKRYNNYKTNIEILKNILQ